MMDQLTSLAAEIEAGLRSFISRNLPENALRGAYLDVDEYWMDAWNLRQLRHLSYDYRYAVPVLRYMDYNDIIMQFRRLYDLAVDFKWRPPDWGAHSARIGFPIKGENGPLYIRAVVRSEQAESLIDLPRQYENYAIVYERRPPSRALSAFKDAFASIIPRRFRSCAASGPLSVGVREPQKTAGSLGAVLRCRSSQKDYMIGSAHVLGMNPNTVFSPGPFEDRGLRGIGEVYRAALPPLKRSDQPSSADLHATASRLDFAAAEIWGGADAVRPLGWIPSVGSIRDTKYIAKNDRVTISGKVSGHIEARIGAVCVWDEVLFEDGAVPGGPRCFGGLLELKAPRTQYVREDLVRPGDSGAAVLSQLGDGHSWDAMLVSGDGPQAYACFASHIVDECRTWGMFPSGHTFV